MRANSLNLKKKIAFIASLAMIAGTAAYLPANIAQNLGFGNSIVANAAATGALTTFKAYVKVDGKYLAKDAASKDLKLVSTVTNNYEYVNIADATETTGILKTNDSTALTTAATDDEYIASDVEVELPEDTAPGAEVTIEFVPETGAALDKNSATSIDVGTLNDYGMVQVAANTDVVTAAKDDGTQTDTVDFSGVQFGVNAKNATSLLVNGNNKGKIYIANGTGFAASGDKEISAGTTNGTYNAKEDVFKLSDYKYVKSGDIYARVLKGVLNDPCEPNTVIKVNLGASGNWTVTGAGVDKETTANVVSGTTAETVLTMNMGENGVATSGLITATKGSEKEYFVVTVDNAAQKVDADDITVDTWANLGVAGSGTGKIVDTFTNATRYKTVKKLTTATVGGGTNFVTEYTIYNNDVKVNAVTDNAPETIVLKADGKKVTAFDLPSVTGYQLNGKDAEDAVSTEENDVVSKTDDNTTISYTASVAGTVADDGAKADLITFKTSTAGTLESPIIAVKNSAGISYVKFKFTNEYKVELVDGNKHDADYEPVYAEVTKGQEIETKPANASKAGFTFKGWTYGENKLNYESQPTPANDGADAFTTLIDRQQNTTTETANNPPITPNMKLYAKYEQNKYTAEFDANGGYLANGTFGSSYTTVAVDADNNTTKASITLTADDNKSSAATGYTPDLKTYNDVSDNGDAVRLGYTFKGWALTPDAAEAVETKDYDTFRPAENNGKVTLYAVWEAKSNNIQFRTMNFNGNNGAVDAMSGKASTMNVAASGSVAAADNAFYTGATQAGAATFSKASDGVLTVKTGDKFASLPTPYKKGYTFDGWYRISVNAKSDTFMAEEVTNDTVLDGTKFDQTTAGAYGDTSVTLYAKFSQNTYKVDFDLDGGKWADTVTESTDLPATYKYNDTTVKFYNSKGNPVDDDAFNALVPVKGSGNYYTFKGYTLNTKTTKYTTNYSDAVKKLADAEDVTFKANWSNSSSTGTGYINLELGGGKFYETNNLDTHPVYAEVGKIYDDGSAQEVAICGGDHNGAYTAAAPSVSGTSNAALTEKINGNEITDTDNDNKYYVVARAGYTFTGWFADEACTTPYEFKNYPNNTEVTVYAGWKADTDTRYNVKYNLISVDGSIIQVSDTSSDKNTGSDRNKFSFSKQYYGETGSEISAADKKIIYNGVTYVFDAKKSANQAYKGKIVASFEDTQANSTSTPAVAAAGLAAGEFENAGIAAYDSDADKSGYTVLYATYVDESAVTPEEKTLGTVNDVAVDDNGKVTWSAAENAVKYKVVKTVGTAKGYSGWLTETTYEFKNAPKETYKVRVVAEDAKGNQTWGKEITVTPKVDENALGKVDAATITVGADRKTVTWTAAANAAKYKLVKTVNGKKYYSSEVTTNTYTFNTATQDAFTVKVVAINADGTEKTWSDAVTVDKSETTLGKVVNPTVEGKKVTWTAVEGATKYKAFKVVKDKTGAYKTYGGNETDKTTYTFGSLPATDYKVYVVAYNDASNSVGTAVKVSAAPKVTGVKVSADGKTVTWTKADGAAKYQVKKYIGNQSFYTGKTTDATMKLSTALKPGEYVQVVSFDADGNSTYSDAVTLG